MKQKVRACVQCNIREATPGTYLCDKCRNQLYPYICPSCMTKKVSKQGMFCSACTIKGGATPKEDS